MSDREGAALELGAALRKLRARTGCTAAEFAKIVRWSHSKVSRIESNLVDMTETDVVRFAAYCRATPDELEKLVSWSRKAELPGYWLPRQLSRLVFHENTSISSLSYDPVAVPALLQTENYMRALAKRDKRSPRDVEYLVGAGVDRQCVLERRQFDFFVHERALRSPVGDNRVMAEQLRTLVPLADHPWLNIRIIPGAVRSKGPFENEFVLFYFHDGRHLLHLGHNMVQILEEAAVLAEYREHLASIAAVALGKAQSREMLAALAREFDTTKDATQDSTLVTRRYAVETHLHRVSSRSQR